MIRIKFEMYSDEGTCRFSFETELQVMPKENDEIILSREHRFMFQKHIDEHPEAYETYIHSRYGSTEAPDTLVVKRVDFYSDGTIIASASYL